MTTSRSCSEVSSLKKRTQTQRNAWRSSKTGPAQGTFTAAQPVKGWLMTFSSLTTMVCSHSGWASFAQKRRSRMVIDIHPNHRALPDGPSVTHKNTKEECCQLYGGCRVPPTAKFAGSLIGSMRKESGARKRKQRTSLMWILLAFFTFNSLSLHCTHCCCFAFSTLYSLLLFLLCPTRGSVLQCPSVTRVRVSCPIPVVPPIWMQSAVWTLT